MNEPHHDHMLDLLAAQATEGLPDAEREELDRLLARTPDLDTESFERAAAAVQLALVDEIEPLPSDLRSRLEQDAEAFFRSTAARPSPAEPSAREPRPRGSLLASPWLSWTVAAAAVLLAVFALGRGGRGPAPAPSAGEQRTLFVASATDVVRTDWASTEDPLGQGVRGDVVWSPSSQEGYMRFENLAVNDPDRNQYQLWIFDAERDAARPVDGGVFDVSADGESVVPIVAKLAVSEATLFAVTLERPGGVVVSSRERLLLTAAVQ